MLLTVETPEAEKYLIYDCSNTVIPYVTSFNTETKEIELMIQTPKKATGLDGDIPVLMQEVVKEDGNIMAPILVKFTLEGAYAKKDGQLVK